jgi:hypothetical protein
MMGRLVGCEENTIEHLGQRGDIVREGNFYNVSENMK